MKKSKHQPQSVCPLNPFIQRWRRLLPVGLLMLAAWNGLAASGDWQDRRMTLDTVHLDLDAGRVHLCWRLTLDPEWELVAAVIAAEGGELDG